MSRKTWIILAIIFGILCLCVVIGGIFFLTQGAKLLGNTVNSDPGKTAAVAEGIADYDLPAGYSNSYSMSLFGMSVVGITQDGGDMMIVLFQFPEGSEMSAEQMEKQMRDVMAQQSGRYELTKTGEQQVTLRGQPVTLSIFEGEGDKRTPIRQVVGSFQGKGGTAFLMVMGNQATWDQQALDDFIASMR